MRSRAFLSAPGSGRRRCGHVWARPFLVLFRLIPASLAAAAIAKGTDVYLFLAGMMLLADLARYEGVFDWMAGIAVGAAKG